jgi:hypothetical protein
MSTLSDGASVITLDDLRWIDELAWSPVRQEVDYSITGALVVHVGTMQAGRLITLQSPDQLSGWINRSALVQCRAWAATPGQVLTLMHDGATYSVAWRTHDTAIDADPLVPFSDTSAADLYRVTLRLMTI